LRYAFLLGKATMSEDLRLSSFTRVLVVDDNDFMRKLVAKMLLSFGIRSVIEAGDGAEALRIASEISIDVIVTDYRMPGLDGFEFCRTVRRRPTPRRAVPILLMSGHTERALVERARDAGFDEVLAKPLAPRTLHQKVLTSLSRPRPFIDADAYAGPCRRRRTELIIQACRRMGEADRVVISHADIAALIDRLRRKRTSSNAAAIDARIKALLEAAQPVA
jgi:two-component system, chemotaxis family, chemotaxis protein CheY